jgi:hypothetical protein
LKIYGAILQSSDDGEEETDPEEKLFQPTPEAATTARTLRLGKRAMPNPDLDVSKLSTDESNPLADEMERCPPEHFGREILAALRIL